MPPRDSTDFMRRSVVGVARTRIIGQSRSTKSSGTLPTSSDQPVDVLLQVSSLYQDLDLITELKTLCRVVPLVFMELVVF